MKYILSVVVGLIIFILLNLHFMLWCLWYLDYDWQLFRVRRFRARKELNLSNGIPGREYHNCTRIYSILQKESWEDCFMRHIKFDFL